MKYILTIVAIALVVTACALFRLWPPLPPPTKNAVLSVNGQVFTNDFFKKQMAENGYHSESEDELRDSVITRALLIQEAQRLGIDREEPFRLALKNYYEQSLLKLLTDRQYDQIQATVSKQEIDSFLSCYGTTYIFTTLSPQQGNDYTEQQHTILFDDLSDSLRLILAGMKPGEVQDQFDTGSTLSKIRLDAVLPAQPGYQAEPPDRNHIKMLLQKYKKSQLMNAWVNNLRQKASIIVYKEAERHE